jgi:sugar phosphate isomerase/epimerase
MEVINHYETCLYYNIDRALEFLTELNHENVAVMIDTYHMNIEEDSFSRAIRRTSDKLANFHISDSNRLGVGHGHIDFFSIIKALKDVGYDGYIGLEPQAPGPNPFEAIKSDDSKEIVEVYLKESMDILRAIEAAV